MPWFSRMVSRRRTRSSSVSRSARVAGAGVAVGTGADEGATETALYGPRGSVSLIAFFRSVRRNSSARNACAVSSLTFASCSERVEKSSVETLICFGHDSEGFVALPSGGFTAGSNGVEDAERAVAASTRATPGETEAAWCRAGDFLDANANANANGDANANGYGNVPDATSGRVSHRIDDSLGMVDMVVRPSGVLDPEVTILPRNEQLPALAAAVRRRAARGEASLVCALTKADCEDLAGYLCAIGGIRADWLHSGLTAKERAVKLQALQQGDVDCLVGAQLLREGLDIPQVSLVAILDADKEGFLRAERSLIQTIGRAARHVEGVALLYADNMTDSMAKAISETDRRRAIQQTYNDKHGIVPTAAGKKASNSILSFLELSRKLKQDGPDADLVEVVGNAAKALENAPDAGLALEALPELIDQLEAKMKEAAKKLYSITY